MILLSRGQEKDYQFCLESYGCDYLRLGLKELTQLKLSLMST